MLQLQIARDEVAEKDAAAAPVGEGVEELRGDAVLIVQNAHTVALELPATHEGEGIGIVAPDLDALPALLEVVPEKALAERDKIRGEAPAHLIRGPLEDRGVDLLVQRGRDAKGVAPVPPRDRGEDERRRIQAIPVFLHDRPPAGRPRPA